MFAFYLGKPAGTWSGDARLYHLTEPLDGHEHVVVTDACVFGTDPNGFVLAQLAPKAFSGYTILDPEAVTAGGPVETLKRFLAEPRAPAPHPEDMLPMGEVAAGVLSAALLGITDARVSTVVSFALARAYALGKKRGGM